MNGETIREKINWKFQTVHQVHRRALCGLLREWRTKRRLADHQNQWHDWFYRVFQRACVRVCVFSWKLFNTQSHASSERKRFISHNNVWLIWDAKKIYEKKKERKKRVTRDKRMRCIIIIEFSFFLVHENKTKQSQLQQWKWEEIQTGNLRVFPTNPTADNMSYKHRERWERHTGDFFVYIWCSRHRWWRAHTVWRAQIRKMLTTMENDEHLCVSLEYISVSFIRIARTHAPPTSNILYLIIVTFMACSWKGKHFVLVIALQPPLLPQPLLQDFSR